MSISSRLVRSRFVSPYARGWIEARIGLMNASSGEVVSGMFAGRFQRGPRRSNCSSTIFPVVFSHSLTRGMPAACARLRNGAQNPGGERSLDLRQQVIDRVPVDVLGA